METLQLWALLDQGQCSEQSPAEGLGTAPLPPRWCHQLCWMQEAFRALRSCTEHWDGTAQRCPAD